ncbi:hypothetical protein SBRCBS47491_005279 [Sporothrix bragantina]|uniref:Uncharacterized protein n=1 Tax=Sporothrix bragantina TaxID=671064 RepID=A0ABP0BVF8_9PEZI
MAAVCSYAFDGQLGGSFFSEDANILYRYLHYHDILAQFSVSHWRRPEDVVRQLSIKFKSNVVVFKCGNCLDRFNLREGLGDYLQYEIYLLSLILRASKQAQLDLEFPIGDYQQLDLDKLEAELERSFMESKVACADIPFIDKNDASAVVAAGLSLQRYFFLAATWVYFQRACRFLTGPSSKIDALIDEAFAWAEDIHRLNIRIAPFSLFLIGSEANTEARRHTVMEFIHRRPELLPITSEALTIRGDQSKPSQVDCLIAAAWAQDDLHDDSDGYLDYVTKMQYVITARSVMPALM